MTALALIEGGAERQRPADDAVAANGRMVAALAASGLRPVRNSGGAIVRFEAGGGDIDDGARRSLLSRVEAALQCCAPETLRIEAAKLKAATVAPAGDDLDIVLRLQLLVDVLAEYPTDIVRQACREQRRRSKWLPAEAELAERCEGLLRPRRAALAALQPFGAHGVWAARMSAWEKWGRRRWLGDWGPAPGDPRCWVPPTLLDHHRITERPAPPAQSASEVAAVVEAVRLAATTPLRGALD